MHTVVMVLVYSFVLVTLATAAACYQRYRTALPYHRRLLLVAVLLLLIVAAVIDIVVNRFSWDGLLLFMVQLGCVGLIEALIIRNYGR
jgi:hypothetical protein